MVTGSAAPALCQFTAPRRLADRPGEGEQGDDAERRLQMLHVVMPPHGGG